MVECLRVDVCRSNVLGRLRIQESRPPAAGDTVRSDEARKLHVAEGLLPSGRAAARGPAGCGAATGGFTGGGVTCRRGVAAGPSPAIGAGGRGAVGAGTRGLCGGEAGQSSRPGRRPGARPPALPAAADATTVGTSPAPPKGLQVVAHHVRLRRCPASARLHPDRVLQEAGVDVSAV